MRPIHSFVDRVFMILQLSLVLVASRFLPRGQFESVRRPSADRIFAFLFLHRQNNLTIDAETVLESMLIVLLRRLRPGLPQAVVADGDEIQLIIRVSFHHS